MQDLQLSQHEQRGDFTFLSHSHDFESILDHMHQDNDEVERLSDKIKEFQLKNKQLSDYIKLIDEKPHQIKDNPQAEVLLKKIDIMEKENRKLREFIRTAEQRQPVNYTDREKVASGMATPRNYKKELFKDEIDRESLRSIPRNRRVLEEIDNNFEKVLTQVSTCQNYPIYHTGTKEEPEQVKIRKLAQLTDTEKKIKNGLKLTAQSQMCKKQVVRRELNIEDVRVSDVKPKNIKNMKALEEYKNKLVSQLKKSNLRESQLKKILSELMKVHKTSIDKFNELARMLEELRQTQGEDITDQIDIVQKYQEALRLEQILVEIHSKSEEERKEQQKQNEEQLIHLKSIRRELFKILQKLGLKVDINEMSLEVSIQTLCNQIIFNVYLPSIRSVSSTNAKLQRIRELTDLQKVNNSKIISELKNKQQSLSKQLMNLQIGSKHRIE